MNRMFDPLSADEVVAAGESPIRKAAEKTPIVPVPADAPPMNFRHPKLGEPSQSWPYHDADGRLVGYVCRWNFRDEDGNPAKEVLPVTFCQLGADKRAWRSKGMPAPRPLFGLPAILSRTDAPILVTEGEKARDAAEQLFPDMVATTPAHGAKSPQLTDFGPCAGRTVVIATDHDEPGRKDAKGKPLHPGRDFGDKVCELARKAGAAQVLHLHPDRLGGWSWHDGERQLRVEPLSDGWDIADALAEGWTPAAIAENRDDPTFLVPYRDAAARKAAHSMLADGGEAKDDEPRYRLVDRGVERRVDHTDKETGAVTSEWKWLCSYLEIVAETRTINGDDWGRLLRISDRDGRSKQWAMPMAMLAGDGLAYRERLFTLGLRLASGRGMKDALADYITTAAAAEKAQCVAILGWQSGTFLYVDNEEQCE